jgi:hypothetical protein
MSKQTKPSIEFAHRIWADGSSFSKSPAHEITDAITAVVINAQAGLRLLRAQSPDLEKVRQALNNIANDGKRAGDIVVRLRMNKVAADGAAEPYADNPHEWWPM